MSKSFGASKVLDRVDLNVAAGQVHGLLGGNGSGKSTLIKILAGVHRADEGTVTCRGLTVAAADVTPRLAARSGLRFVHQDLALVAELSVAENLALGRGYPRKRGLGGIDWRAVNSGASVLLGQYGLAVDPTQALAELSPAQRTMVAVIRALHDAEPDSVLVLDEPTATMPREQSIEFLGLLRRLVRGERAVVFVSHRIGEILQFTDALTCLRDGRVVRSGPTSGLSHDDVVDLIAGTAPGRPDTRGDRAARVPGEHRGSPVVARVTMPNRDGGDATELALRGGEIVGVAGLLGSGRSRVLRGCFGLSDRRGSAGPASPHAAVRAGVAYVPERRVADALFADHSLVANVVAARQARYWRGLMRNGAQRRDASRVADQCMVRASSMSVPISALSGGNQQKAVLARWLLTRPRLLLLDEPTQGVDVGGRAQIHQLIRHQADQGTAVLMTSADFEEVAELCDRVVVIVHGEAVGHLEGTEITVDAITRLAHSGGAALTRQVS